MSRRRDIAETLTNTVGGFGLAYLVSLFVFPIIGVPTNPATAFGATFTMFIVSTLRGFAVRRFYRWHEHK
jgi:hypothetical protein